MSEKSCVLLFLLLLVAAGAQAQQSVTVISRCGGTETVTIPYLTDLDNDGMDDGLEQKLLRQFTPVFIQFSDESCPGPATDGTGDSNLVVCHIYPYPQQYTFSASTDSVLTHPVALVPAKGLVTGMIWYDALIKVNAALLYGKDCGLLGHTADVEGFSYSLRYTGPDTLAGWMYDTIMQHWEGVTIQSVSHAGTLCEHIETQPYSPAFGRDTVYASPDKHGNYLTIGGCNTSFICNPGCNGTPSEKTVRPINLGEPNATLISDLGSYYGGYAGEDPWSTNKFLASQGGDAGTISDKMIRPLTSDFVQGQILNSQSQICAIYKQCYGPSAHAYSDYTCAGIPYNFRGTYLYSSGIYNDTMTNSYGCDSIISLNLSVIGPDNFFVSISTCSNNYDFNGQQLSNSGTYTDTLTNVYGCDSLVSLHLVLNHASFISSVVSICQGSSYNFNGQQLSLPGVYTDTLINTNGCDSVLTLQLQIDSLLPPAWNTIADTFYSDGHPILLTGGTPTGGTYSGPGVSGNIFFPDSLNPGSYTLTYTISNTTGCTASVNHTIIVLVAGISDPAEMNAVKIYPNPAKDLIIAINNGFINEAVVVSVFDVTGKEIETAYDHHGNIITIQTTNLLPGFYWVSFRSKNFSISRKVAVNK